MRSLTRTSTVVLAAAAALLLTAASLLGIALLRPQQTLPVQGSLACSAPSLDGTTVHVTLGDMGPRMMRGPIIRGGMWISADRATVAHGRVSFLVTNAGHLPHELMVLALPKAQSPGARTLGPDGRVDETGFYAEASASCAQGEGTGIIPSASSWVTVDLPPGRYELVCNYPGHYVSGMYAELTVT